MDYKRAIYLSDIMNKRRQKMQHAWLSFRQELLLLALSILKVERRRLILASDQRQYHLNPFQGLVWQIPQGRGQRRNLLTQTQPPQSGFPVLTDGFGVQSLQVGLSQGRILDPDHGPQGIVQVVEEDLGFQCLGAGQVGETRSPIPYPDNQKSFPVQADIDSLQSGRGRG